jgi:molecular chaperone GrpE (heat shock protein)
MDTQVRLGKDREGKESIGEDIICDSEEPQPPQKVKHKYGEYNNVLLTDDELSKLKTEYSDYEERIERLSSYIASKGTKYKSHYATIRNWARKDKEQPKKSSYQESIENRMSVVDNW